MKPLKNQFSIGESVRFVIAATMVRDQIDKELGDLLLAAHAADNEEAWSKVHDRFNVLGEFQYADRLREVIADLHG